MPTFLKLVMVGAAVMGTIGVIGAAGFLAATALVPGPYMVNGRPATFDEFIAFAIPLLGSYFLMFAALLAVSWGLRHERLWVRPLIVAVAACGLVVPLTAAFLGGVSFRGAMPGIIASVGMVVVFWWQLYYDDDILAYYSSIREEQRG